MRQPETVSRSDALGVAGECDAAPIAPSQRLPLIAHTLREARVAIAELRYEGRGGIGGFITEFHDRHRLKSLSQSVDERIAQQLTGFFGSWCCAEIRAGTKTPDLSVSLRGI